MANEPATRVWEPAVNPSGLTELEVASGMVVGQGSRLGPTGPSAAGPLAALREVAARLLERPPCVLAFSGGRDSSVLLALLVQVARDEGLPQPIAVTARWDDDQASDESVWQEQVVAAVGADQWEILRPGTDLDLLGEAAVGVLGGLGLLWPAPAYVFTPLVTVAAGGTLISGEGGDEAFGLWPHGRFRTAVRRRRRPPIADLVALGAGCAPRGLRRAYWRRRLPPYQTWLRTGALADLATRLADDQADDSLRWDDYQWVSRSRRSVHLTVDTLERLCARHDARFAAPFLDVGVVGALARWGGRFGAGDRTDVMQTLFADLLPAAILERTSKASFGGVFWGPCSRRFAREWDGTGVPEELVDTEALREAWLAPVPVYGAALPLHAAWLATSSVGSVTVR